MPTAIATPKNQELEVLQKQTATVVERAQAFPLDSDAQLEKAAQVLSWLAAKKKEFEALRIKMVKPLNDHVATLNAMFKPSTNILTEARAIMDAKIIAWNRAKEAERAAEEARVKKEAEKLSKKTGVAVQEIIESAPVQDIPKTVGTLTIKKVWTYEVVNLLEVSRQFLKADEAKIGQAIRDGERSLPGIRIYEKDITSTR